MVFSSEASSMFIIFLSIFPVFLIFKDLLGLISGTSTLEFLGPAEGLSSLLRIKSGYWI